MVRVSLGWLRGPDTYRIYNYCALLSGACSSMTLHEPHSGVQR